MAIEMNSLRILLSAYACEPGKGSEPGVGWNWALTLAARGYQVWVITRTNNRELIERYMSALPEGKPENLNFIYYDLPAWAKWWKRGRRGVHLYYLLWQWGAFKLARRCNAEIGFDLVHHVTFVSARQPSFMGGLGIPFIFGPVGGGERSPLRLRKGYSLNGWVNDILRDLANAVVKIDPFMHLTFVRAAQIFVTSTETRQLVPSRYRSKTKVQLAIALDANDETGVSHARNAIQSEFSPRILFVGQFVSWKGMHLGLCAFARMLELCPGARLTLVGQGPEENNWRQLAEKLGVAEKIDWLPWQPRAALAHLYWKHDIFLFPSLHDSGGMVVLEAMANGLPVICMKLGGPGVLVDEGCGHAVEVAGLDAEAVVTRLAESLTRIAKSPELMRRLSGGAVTKASTTSWDTLVAGIYESFEHAREIEAS